jgi:mono/diheme cytochrome c family protein
VVSEQWLYQLASLTAFESPAHRWPQLAANPTLAPDASARRGQQVFATDCLPCHRLNGGGEGEKGPDLGWPMNATDYLTNQGLRALVRDPRSVRTWPLQQMPGFGADALPEADLEALVAYLRHITQHKAVASDQR